MVTLPSLYASPKRSHGSARMEGRVARLAKVTRATAVALAGPTRVPLRTAHSTGGFPSSQRSLDRRQYTRELRPTEPASVGVSRRAPAARGADRAAALAR